MTFLLRKYVIYASSWELLTKLKRPVWLWRMPRQLFLRFCPKERVQLHLLGGEINLHLPSVSNSFGKVPTKPVRVSSVLQAIFLPIRPKGQHGAIAGLT